MKLKTAKRCPILKCCACITCIAMTLSNTLLRHTSSQGVICAVVCSVNQSVCLEMQQFTAEMCFSVQQRCSSVHLIEIQQRTEMCCSTITTGFCWVLRRCSVGHSNHSNRDERDHSQRGQFGKLLPGLWHACHVKWPTNGISKTQTF